jgi:hypothetical protein
MQYCQMESNRLNSRELGAFLRASGLAYSSRCDDVSFLAENHVVCNHALREIKLAGKVACQESVFRYVYPDHSPDE